MSDLTNRLRIMAQTGWNPIGEEAADEIDRLKKENIEQGEFIIELEEKQRRFYKADGDYFLMNSEEEVIELRKAASKENEQLKAEVKRLSERDCQATIQLCYETKDYPFNKEDLKIIDVGVADNTYIVESKVLTETQAKLATIERETWEKCAEISENICPNTCGCEDYCHHSGAILNHFLREN